MDTELIKTMGQIAGIGGISLGVFLLLFREVIKKNIFPSLKKDHAFSLLRLLLILVWSIAVIGIGAWVFTKLYMHKNSKEEKIVSSIENKPYNEGQNTSNNEKALMLPPQTPTPKEGVETIVLHRVIINATQDAKTSVDKKIRGYGNIELQLIEGMHLITIETDTHIWSYSKQIDREKFFNITSDKMKPKN
ncbi:hypothetical protein QUF75_03835 [Desulfococcaceae bacterium HSG7]|nr:hypothetical protein [Desulfococcaceae bacterium HSG7]